jgi:hypothetical protein
MKEQDKRMFEERWEALEKISKASGRLCVGGVEKKTQSDVAKMSL